MGYPRTDLAMERLNHLGRDTVPGVDWDEWRQEPLSVHRVTVLDELGAQALDRPVGQYFTAQLDSEACWDSQWMWEAAQALSRLLRPLLPQTGTVLVAGLGNRAMTCDALGPLALEHLMVTRHLTQVLPDTFGAMRPVCAIAPGVLGTTGLETAELIRGAVRQAAPAAVIAIDALAARSLDRLCRTFQLSDTGITPGSGACNPRQVLNAQTLGIPVIALGVPTVVDARTLALDLLSDRHPGETPIPGGDLLVSPKDIDLQAARCARVLGHAINLALHGDLTAAEMEQFLC